MSYKLYVFIGILACVNFASFAEELRYDCDGFKPFRPIDTLKAEVTVSRLGKFVRNNGKTSVEKTDETICKSKTPLVVPVKDIRGLEADWYYCDKPSPENYLVCETECKGMPAKIAVKPAMVIRKWNPKDALDTHMHVYLIPENDESKILDNFSRALRFDLTQREITLNTSSGGQGPNSDQDRYFVELRFYKR